MFINDLLDQFAPRREPLVEVTPKTTTANPLVCGSCGGAKVIVESMPTCSQCGRVDAHVIDDNQEWGMTIGDDGRPNALLARCSTQTADTDLFSGAWGQNTTIETKWNSSIQVKRFAKITFCQAIHHKDRALNDAYKEIDEVCHSLPDFIRHEAKLLWKRFTELKLTRGVVRSGIKANCVLHACASKNVRRTRKEVAEMFRIQPGDVARTYEMFRQVALCQKEKATNSAPTSPADVVVRMLNRFPSISRDERVAILRECATCENCAELMSKTPRSVAAVILYRNLKDKGITRAEIASMCDVSVPTIQKIEATIVTYLERSRNV